MSGRRIRLAVGVLGTIVALVAEAIALQAGEPASAAMLHLAIGLTYLYGGLAIWAHEPANRTGRLMTAVGLTWFIGSAVGSSIPVVSELALAFSDTFTILLVALVLAYPTGRLESQVDRAAVAILAVGATALNIVYSTSLPLVTDKSTGLYGGLALATMTAIVVIRRWVIAPARSRRDLLPVLIAGLVFMVTLIINIVRRIADVPDDLGAIQIAVWDLAPAAIPVALLIGFFRQSERRQRALVEAIPDRVIRFTHDGRYVESNRIEDDGLAAASGGLDGRRFHELLFREAGPAALAATADALDTGELQAFDVSLDLAGGTRQFEARIAPSGADEVTAIIRDFTTQRTAEAELRRSRARIVEAGDAERRRLERDLHDGAQQRLVSLSLALRLLRIPAGRERPTRIRRRSPPPTTPRRRSSWRSGSCASSPAASTRRSSPRRAWDRRSPPSPSGPRCRPRSRRCRIAGSRWWSRRRPTSWCRSPWRTWPSTRRRPRRASPRPAIRPPCGSRSPTTASAARTRAAERASAACRTVSRRWAGG